LAAWQKDELAGTDLAALVAMTENENMEVPTPDDMVSWMVQLDLDGTIVADSDKLVLYLYLVDNPDNQISTGVSVLIDKEMVIREVFGDADGSIALSSIEQLLGEQIDP
jgi:hypothetical protein